MVTAAKVLLSSLEPPVQDGSSLAAPKARRKDERVPDNLVFALASEVDALLAVSEAMAGLSSKLPLSLEPPPRSRGDVSEPEEETPPGSEVEAGETEYEEELLHATTAAATTARSHGLGGPDAALAPWSIRRPTKFTFGRSQFNYVEPAREQPLEEEASQPSAPARTIGQAEVDKLWKRNKRQLERKQERANAQRAAQKEDEVRQCIGQPAISDKSRKLMKGKHTVPWEKGPLDSTAQQRAYEKHSERVARETSECTFAPRTNSKSQAIFGYMRHTGRPWHERVAPGDPPLGQGRARRAMPAGHAADPAKLAESVARLHGGAKGWVHGGRRKPMAGLPTSPGLAADPTTYSTATLRTVTSESSDGPGPGSPLPRRAKGVRAVHHVGHSPEVADLLLACGLGTVEDEVSEDHNISINEDHNISIMTMSSDVSAQQYPA